MKIVSWNVNGIVACRRKGFLRFLANTRPDILCCQEIKTQVPLNTPGYLQFWNPARRNGFSGTLVLTRRQPLSCSYELGDAELDGEGRLITLEYPDFYLLKVYMKKLVSVLAILAITASICSVSAFADSQVVNIGGSSVVVEILDTMADGATSGSCGSGITWAIDDNGKVVIQAAKNSTGYMMGFNEGKSPWAASEAVTSVEIQEGVASIGSYAFQGCTNLKEVSFPSSLVSVDLYAFEGCTSLEQITLPVNATIYYKAFSGCTGLRSITIPYTNITRNFAGCTNIKNITYLGNQHSWERANGVEFIAGLSDVSLQLVPRTASGNDSSNIAWSLDQDGELRFTGMGKMLEYYDLLDRFPEWKEYSTEFKSIVIEPGITSIGMETFYFMTGGVETVTIPTSVTEIQREAFIGGNFTVHYQGTPEQWAKIKIGEYNDGLTNATILYNCEMPISSSRFTDVVAGAYYEKPLQPFSNF